MLIASGAALVLFTWLVCTFLLATIGLLPALAVHGPRTFGWNAAPVLRTAMWWGLLLVTIFAYLTNLVWPLQSGAAAIAGLVLVAVVAIPGWLVFIRERPSLTQPIHRPAMTALWIALGLSLVYLAAAAVGPVTNYDSGLYHLGAISYAAHFPMIPGLANLYFAFGYGNAEFPLAALLGNGPWQGEGFRLLNGLMMVMAVVDLGLRAHHRKLGPGFFVLLSGILAAWVPMVALSDYWVTSPTQDSSVFVVTVVATAYLSQAARGGRSWVAEGATAAALGILLVLLRPTMVVYAGATVVVVLALAGRRRARLHNQRPWVATAFVALIALGAGGAALARDWVLSGWLQYPLSIHAFDVPWLAADPTGDRVATLGFHRDPADLWNAASGWAWIGAWLVDRVRQWETYEFLGLAVVALVLAALAHRATPPNAGWRTLASAWAPSVAATAFWWLATPPSYRFAWGPLFTLATIPIGWSLWLLASNPGPSRIPARSWRDLAVVAVAVPILLVTGYSAIARFHAGEITERRSWHLGVTIPYAVAPIVDVPVREVVTDSGLVLQQPAQSEQCWEHFPLCTPRPTSTLRLRGADIAAGFLP